MMRTRFLETAVMTILFSHDIGSPLFFLIHHLHVTSLFIVVLIHSFSQPTIVLIVHQLFTHSFVSFPF